MPLLGTVLACLALAGCSNTDPIITYTVPTEVPEQLQADNRRMLAAIVPHGDQAWFFKVVAEQPAIDPVVARFREFVQTVPFEDGNPVLDELPEGWHRAGEKPFRYASININTPAKQLDLSISKLSRQDDWDQFVAMNVNRWRGQVGLEDDSSQWAGAQPIDVAAADAQAVWVDLIGKPATAASGSSAAPMAPFASRTGMPDPQGMPTQQAGDDQAAAPAGSADEPGSAQDKSTQTGSTGRGGLQFDRPEGWRDGRMSSMRLAAFNVGPEDADTPTEVTVITAGGDLRGNVARWLGQVRGGNVPDEVVDQALADAEKLTVDGRAAQRFRLTGENPHEGSAIDATIIPLEGNFSLFVKMTGSAETVREQSEEMKSFLESLTLAD